MAGTAPRRLLVVLDAGERGGAENYVVHIARGLPARGWTVDVALPSRTALHSLRRDLVAAGATTHGLRLDARDARGRSAALRAVATDAVRTARVVHRLQPDVTLVNLPTPDAGLGPLLGSTLTGAPTAAILHLVRPGLKISRQRRRLYALMRRRQAWLAVSQVTADSAAAFFDAPTAEYTCIPNGIDGPLAVAPGARDRIRGELGVGADEPLLLTVGRLSGQKGQDVLLEAIPAVLERHPAAVFAWAGDGARREYLHTAIGAAGLQERVRLLGPRDDIGDLLAAADASVLPSRFEGAPFFSLLESLAAGLAVVVTDLGAGGAVDDGEHAVVVPSEDAPALARAITALLEDPVRAAALGAAGRRLVAEHYTADIMLDRTSAVLTTHAGARHG